MKYNYCPSLLFPLFGSMAVSCAEAEKPKPNILFIVAEDASPDLGCYGNEIVTTPVLDKLASEGVKFNNAYCTYSVSSPSRGCIFTGLYPHQNGQVGLATHKYEFFPDMKTLPVYMKELGYRTGCLGKIHVIRESDVPFDYWGIRTANFEKKNLPDYAKKAAEFISASDDPFLLMVNFPDSHFPVQKDVQGLPTVKVDSSEVKEGLWFVGANSERLREYTECYYDCMNRLDESVGMLLDSLQASGKADNTVIFFISDHGAQFSRGKTTNYEGGLKIPCIIKWPKLIKPGTVKDELVSTIDLLPTFIDIAGGVVPEELPGRSLFDLWTKEDVKWRDYVFAGGMGCAPSYHFPKRSVRDSRYKLIMNLNGGLNPSFVHYRNAKGHHVAGTQPEEIASAPEYVRDAYALWKNPPTYELYDLQNDPGEWYNLADEPEYASILERLKTVLYEWRVETCDMTLIPDRLRKINAEMDSIVTNNVNYRKQKDFHYGYVGFLRPDRKAMEEFVRSGK